MIVITVSIRHVTPAYHSNGGGQRELRANAVGRYPAHSPDLNVQIDTETLGLKFPVHDHWRFRIQYRAASQTAANRLIDQIR